MLVELWEKVLGDVEVGPMDNFYDLGGDSLSAAGVIAEMERRLGVVVDPVEFGFQTLRQLARMCEERGGGEQEDSRSLLSRMLERLRAPISWR